MSTERANIEVKRSSERNFGVVFSIVFLIIGLHPLLSGDGVRWWSVAAAGLMLITTVAAPGVLRTPNRLWFKLGMTIGAVVAPVVMAFVYIVTIIPLGLLIRAFGKDLLREKIDKRAPSYWIERTDKMQPMKNQF